MHDIRRGVTDIVNYFDGHLSTSACKMREPVCFQQFYVLHIYWHTRCQIASRMSFEIREDGGQI